MCVRACAHIVSNSKPEYFPLRSCRFISFAGRRGGGDRANTVAASRGGGGRGDEDVESWGRGGAQEVFAEWVGVEYTVAGLTHRRTIFADHT